MLASIIVLRFALYLQSLLFYSLNHVSSQCARGKTSLVQKLAVHPKFLGGKNFKKM